MDAFAALAAGCLLLLALLWALPRLQDSWRLSRMMRRLPGPPGLPVIGNLLDVMSSDPFERFLQLCARYNTVLRLWVIADFKGAILLELDDIKTILGNPALVDKPTAVYNVFKEYLGPGFVFHTRKVWKPIRTAVSSSLHKSVLASFVPVFHKNAAHLSAQLEEMAEKGSAFDVMPLCGRVAHHAVTDTVLSADKTEICEHERRTYVELIMRANEILMKRLWRPWLRSDFVFSLTKDSKVHRDYRDFSEKLVQKVLSHKREEIAKGKLEGKEPKKGRLSFVDHVLASDTPFCGDLDEEAGLLMIAGSDTTMASLSFICYVLSIRQDWQARIVKELEEVFGGDALRPVEADDLPHLEATERFIKEVLRFFPSVPMIARHIPEDVALPSGHTLPRGSVAAFFLPAVHRDPRWWERPDEFDPDRFLPENAQGRHPYAYLPFSAGPRNCVAHRYAMTFLKTHVAALLRRVQLLPAPGAPSRVQDVPVAMNLSLSVRGGALVRARRRHIPAQNDNRNPIKKIYWKNPIENWAPETYCDPIKEEGFPVET